MLSLSESEALVRLVRAGSSEALLGLAGALENGDLELDSSSVGISAVPGVDEMLASQTAKTFASIKSLDETCVATAIRTAWPERRSLWRDGSRPSPMSSTPSSATAPTARR